MCNIVDKLFVFMEWYVVLQCFGVHVFVELNLSRCVILKAVTPVRPNVNIKVDKG